MSYCAYFINCITIMLVQEKTLYIGFGRSIVSGIHWGSWLIPPKDKGEITVITEQNQLHHFN